MNILLFTTNLRLHDNLTLIDACKFNQEPLLPLVVLDKEYIQSSWLNQPKFSAKKLDFLLQCVHDLQEQLQQHNSNLLVSYTSVLNTITELNQKQAITRIFVQKGSTYEEQSIVETLVNAGFKVIEVWDETLVHLNQLPYDSIDKLHDIFTPFRHKIEKNCVWQKPQEIAELPSLPEGFEFNKVEHLLFFGWTQEPQPAHAAFQLKGGESAARTHLHDYFFSKKLASTYKATRNQMVGTEYSTKFSAYLAWGCISARTIISYLQKFEATYGATENSYWIQFELLWRDYFKFVALKYPNQLFYKSGLKGKALKLGFNEKAFNQWKNGATKCDFVNANMIELAQTGFMSNRGRQNVASYLVKDLGIDWRYGAAYFEGMLIDYDVHSNWGNWCYVAGVGNDPRETRYFNTSKQADMYDSNHAFRNLWLNQ